MLRSSYIRGETETWDRLKGKLMAAKHKVIVSTRPTTNRGSAAERRAAQTAELSTKQAELKQEAAERRAKRANEGDPPASTRRRTASARRSL